MQDLHVAANRFWDLTWERLHHPRTSLFYDFGD